MSDRPALTFRIIIEGILITLSFVGLLVLISPDLAWEIIGYTSDDGPPELSFRRPKSRELRVTPN
jgi:hypothetical protein